MQVYLLTEAEIEAIDELNKTNGNNLLIVCDHGSGPCIACDDVYLKEFRGYAQQLTLDTPVEVEPEGLENLESLTFDKPSIKELK